MHGQVSTNFFFFFLAPLWSRTSRVEQRGNFEHVSHQLRTRERSSAWIEVHLLVFGGIPAEPYFENGIRDEAIMSTFRISFAQGRGLVHAQASTFFFPGITVEPYLENKAREPVVKSTFCINSIRGRGLVYGWASMNIPFDTTAKPFHQNVVKPYLCHQC